MAKQSIELPLPPTLNEQIDAARHHWSKSASIKKKHTNKAANIAKALIPYESAPVYFVFTWRIKNFGRDSDNISAATKFIFDGLVQAKVIPGDNLIKVPGPLVHFFERGDDSVVVEMSDEPIVQIDRL
jgi:hypothetical protein